MTPNEITTKCAEDIYESFYPWACHEENECFIECSDARREGIEKLIPIITKYFTPLLRDKEIIDGIDKMIVGKTDLDICYRLDGYSVTDVFNQDENYKPFPTLREAITYAIQASKPDK